MNMLSWMLLVVVAAAASGTGRSHTLNNRVLSESTSFQTKKDQCINRPKCLRCHNSLIKEKLNNCSTLQTVSHYLKQLIKGRWYMYIDWWNKCLSYCTITTIFHKFSIFFFFRTLIMKYKKCNFFKNYIIKLSSPSTRN
jgi:hypothetical protein